MKRQPQPDVTAERQAIEAGPGQQHQGAVQQVTVRVGVAPVWRRAIALLGGHRLACLAPSDPEGGLGVGLGGLDCGVTPGHVQPVHAGCRCGGCQGVEHGRIEQAAGVPRAIAQMRVIG